MSICVLRMSSYDLQHLNSELNTMELEEQLLPSNLLVMDDNNSSSGDDWILDECKYSRKQKRSYSDYAEADHIVQQAKRQDIGCGGNVLRESYEKLSAADQATFKAIILERTKNGPMDFGPYYVIEQVEEGKINIIQKDMWTRMRYLSAKFDNNVHLIDNWNKVYMNNENSKQSEASLNSLIDATSSSDIGSPSMTDTEYSEEEEEEVEDSTETSTVVSSDSSNDSSVKRPPRVIRFASHDDIVYI